MLDKYFTNITKAEVSVNFFNFEKINRKEIKKSWITTVLILKTSPRKMP